MKMKKTLNRIQVALLQEHINEFEEKDGILTEAFILEGTEDMIFYVYKFESPCKTVKGAILL
ncbi:hypothetical protein [Peribacillus frigoritolerans]|uniref:hypothetical protein n=1 Tax=Peribacillus castrilensis TaxID=2897690 RepID=UPI002DD0EAEE|nr:hypothetical protein [Peribacillus castrilensis]